MKTYRFRPSYFCRRPVVTICRDNGDDTAYDVSAPTYNRFARLANSGDYDVTIEDADYGVAWQLQRKHNGN